MKNTNTSEPTSEKTNAPDNRDRDNDIELKTDTAEVSGSSDCSVVLGKDADIVLGPTSKTNPVNNWDDPKEVTFVDGVWKVIDESKSGQ